MHVTATGSNVSSRQASKGVLQVDLSLIFIWMYRRATIEDLPSSKEANNAVDLSKPVDKV